ncbi:hypothetical protein PanWU01x14_024520 [Parasponia andersonii]|uniref:Uncharacterized protein n=1 Tax=Parasponia andersonii TaxID=3476 RepID=A0A2P5DWM1_PARAD|nr:hypothetical protein PanWU01x14_024520 [Parasponia andersonii]
MSPARIANKVRLCSRLFASSIAILASLENKTWIGLCPDVQLLVFVPRSFQGYKNDHSSSGYPLMDSWFSQHLLSRDCDSLGIAQTE